MERKWMHHLVTSLFAIAVLLATAGELRRDFARISGMTPASLRLEHLLRVAAVKSLVSGAFDQVRRDAMQ